MHSLIKKITDELNFHRKQYYELDDPVISDLEYDKLYQLFLRYKEEYPEVVDQVGFKTEASDFTHDHPMLSLRSTKEIIDAASIFVKTNGTVSCEPKIDGLSVELIYKDQHLIAGSTRGDGFVGENITTNVMLIPEIPQMINTASPVEIYGEVYITKENFIKINDRCRKDGVDEYRNVRNAASGILRSSKNKHFIELLSFFPYTVYGIEATTQKECFQWLCGNGFTILADLILTANCQEDIFEYTDHMTSIRDQMNIEIDGLVFKVEDIAGRDDIGTSSTHPHWAIAYKFKGEQVTTRLNDVVFQVGKSGVVSPVALLDEVILRSSKVKRATLANKARIAEKDIRIGDIVVVEMANDVIPYIASVVLEDRTGKELPIIFPDNCPSCGANLYESGPHVVCTNYECKAQVVGRLAVAVGRNGFNIKGLGPSVIEQLVDTGTVKSIADIFLLANVANESYYEQFGIDSKLIKRIKIAIEKSKDIKLNKFILALGIPEVSVGSATKLAQHYQSSYVSSTQLLSMIDLLAFSDTPGINKQTRANVKAFFSSEAGIDIIRRILSYGVRIHPM